MARKKKESLFTTTLNVIRLVLWELFTVIVPTIITIYQFWTENKKMIANIPAQVWWLAITVIWFVVVIMIGVQRYKKLEKQAKKKSSRKSRVEKSIKSTHQSGGHTGDVKLNDIKGSVSFGNTYNTYNIQTGQSESHKLLPDSKVEKRPDKNELAYQMSLDIQEFEKLFKQISNDTGDEIVKRFGVARKLLNKLLDEHLVRAKAVFILAEKVENLLLAINVKMNQYGFELKGYLDIIAMEEMYNKNNYPSPAVRESMMRSLNVLWGIDDKSYRTQMISLIKDLTSTLRDEGMSQ